MKVPLEPRADVTVATFTDVEIDPAGVLTLTPQFEEVAVEVPAGTTPQNRTTPGWGAWPQEFVDFHVASGLSSYWYSSGGAADPLKVPLPVMLDLSGATPAPTFTDVPLTSQFAREITWLAGTGISRGWDNGDGTSSFRPVSPVNRDAMAALLHRLAGSPEVTLPATSPFRDVPETNQFYEEIVWLSQQGISTGWEVAGGREFRPLTPVSRDAMAAFLFRYARVTGATAPTTPAFTDVAVDNRFAVEISWLAQSGISRGWSTSAGTEFRPLSPVNRDAMAAFLHRLDALG